MYNRNSENLRSAAEIIQVVQIISSVIVGIIFFASPFGASAVIAGIVIIAVGCFSAWVQRLYYSCISDITETNAEQLNTLKKLVEVLTENPNTSQATPAEETIETTTDRNITASEPTNETMQTEEKTAVFKSRGTDLIECPICHKIQMPNRNSCYSCGCKFIFRDEISSNENT